MAQKTEFERPNSYNFKRAIELYGKERYSDALEYLQREVQDNDKNGYAYSLIADIYLELADTAKAYSDYAAAIKAYPDNSYPYYSRAQLLFEQKRWNESNADYRKMIEIDPGDAIGNYVLPKKSDLVK